MNSSVNSLARQFDLAGDEGYLTHTRVVPADAEQREEERLGEKTSCDPSHLASHHKLTMYASDDLDDSHMSRAMANSAADMI